MIDNTKKKFFVHLVVTEVIEDPSDYTEAHLGDYHELCLGLEDVSETIDYFKARVTSKIFERILKNNGDTNKPK